MTTAILAKLTRPRLSRVHPRERLFARFDQCRRHLVVWISGPPGAGKTTLTASYVESRKLPALWYQMDAGDTDPASFFHYLGLGAREAGLNRGVELPVLTSKYLPDLCDFARRYFRTMFTGLPANALVVLDNYQTLPQASPLQGLIAAAVNEIPESVSLVLLSRVEPAKAFARFAANGALAHIGAEELCLTLDETASIVALDGALDEPVARTLQARTEGWAAGVVLLAKRCRRMGSERLLLNSHEAVADYFDSEILAGADPATRELLFHTAWMPQFTAGMATRLTGDPDAAIRLAALHRQHCFTSLSRGPTPAYQYHALFRDFLLARSTSALGSAQCRCLQHRSAGLLAADGQEEAAFHLYCAADPAAAVDLILAQAPVLVSQGRWQLLQNWLAALPAAMVEAMPWLTLWQGICIAQRNPHEAQAGLRCAYEGFVQAGDALGQGLAAAAMAETHLVDPAYFAALDEWIAALQTFFAGRPLFPCLELELRVLTNTGLALFYRQPRHPLLDECVGRIRTLLANDLGPDHKVAAGTFLLSYFTHTGELADGHAIAAAVAPVLDHPAVRPLTRMWWCTQFAQFGLRSGCLEQTLADLDQAQTLAQEYGLRFALPFLPLCKAQALLIFGQPERAEALLRKVKPMALGTRDRMYCGYLECLLTLGGENTALAVAKARRVSELTRETGASAQIAELALVACAVALARHGEHQAALKALEKAVALRAETPFTRHETGLLKAYLALLRGDPAEARPLLAKAFRAGSERGYLNGMGWMPGMMAKLCAFALEEGIEPQHARQLIRLLNLKPESPAAENWPWPLRIYTLGRFSVRHDDAPLATTRKAPKKLIALLKAIIALGGREVPEQQLADALWPEEEGDAACALLATAVHRLRKLLGDSDAIQVHEGRLTLDARRVWVDAWAFERLVAEPGHGAVDPQRVRKALALYHSSFLADEPELPWAMRLRERLHSKFLRLLTQEGQRLEQAGQIQPAAALHARGIEVDPLAETFYQGLMRCYRHEDRRAEAIAVYRRLRQTLSVTLGVAPSPTTEALYREVMSG